MKKKVKKLKSTNGEWIDICSSKEIKCSEEIISVGEKKVTISLDGKEVVTFTTNIRTEEEELEMDEEQAASWTLDKAMRLVKLIARF